MPNSRARENIEGVRTLPEEHVWDSTLNYLQGDVVQEGAVIYVSIVPFTTLGEQPSSATGEWEIMYQGPRITSVPGGGAIPGSKRISEILHVTQAQYDSAPSTLTGVLYVVKG